jgi:hypothetical protein
LTLLRVAPTACMLKTGFNEPWSAMIAASTISPLCCRRTGGRIFSAQLQHTDFRHPIVLALPRIIRSRASEPTTSPTPTFLINHLTKGGYHGIQSFDQTTV